MDLHRHVGSQIQREDPCIALAQWAKLQQYESYCEHALQKISILTCTKKEKAALVQSCYSKATKLQSCYVNAH